MPTSDTLLAQLKELHPKLIDLSLGRIDRLLEKLGNPHHKLPPVVHVAGTNGKGSTTAILRAILQAAGCRVHVYTSPHLVKFHERISLADADGRSTPIDEDALIDVLIRTQAANEGDDITQFEITTAAAFLAFAERPADVLLLEVGLGGRLDATNVVRKPALSIITPISIDHADKLGNTIERIAAEKAGIMKPEIPVIVSSQPDGALKVITKQAKKVGAPTIIWGRDYEAFEQHGRLVFQCENELLDVPLPALTGAHQLVNAGTAVATALALREILNAPEDRNKNLKSCGTRRSDTKAHEIGSSKKTRRKISESAIEKGLLDVRWPGRMQQLTEGPLPDFLSHGSELWLDGGHNPEAGAAIAITMADLEERAPKPLYLVIGMMTLKDTHGFLSPFRGLARQVIAVPVTAANVPPQEPVELALVARQVGFECTTEASVADALKALDQRHPGAKRILICGSLYLAGSVLAQQQGVTPQPN